MLGNLTFGKRADAFRDALRALLEQTVPRIVLNMKMVGFIDSAGLGEIVACKKRAMEKGGDVRLVLAKQVHGVLVDTYMTKIFKSFTDEAAAIESF